VGGPEGALVVKRATGDDVAALLDEARRLEAAAHPGVVELLSSGPTSDGWELRLAHGGRSLELTGALPAAEVARLAAGLAATLADLHDTGVVHGRIDVSHILIGRDGRAVLCGLGADPVGATPPDDVAAVGVLLAKLLDAGVDMDPIPDRRWFGRRSSTGWERRSLLLLADHACADPPSRRPTARRLAATIAEAVPHAVVTSTARPAALRRGATAPAASRGARVVFLAVALVAGLGLAAGRIGETSATGITPPLEPQAVPSTVTDPVSSRLPPTTSTTAAVVPVRVIGTTLVVGDRRYQVGQPGDLVVIGDWDCVGGVTPALLRPSTGEVFVFGSWPVDGAVSVRPVGQVLGATTPHVEVGAEGCSSLVVQRADGTRVPVPTGPTS
jgi:hypothetical protein